MPLILLLRTSTATLLYAISKWEVSNPLHNPIWKLQTHTACVAHLLLSSTKHRNFLSNVYLKSKGWNHHIFPRQREEKKTEGNRVRLLPQCPFSDGYMTLKLTRIRIRTSGEHHTAHSCFTVLNHNIKSQQLSIRFKKSKCTTLEILQPFKQHNGTVFTRARFSS